MMIWVVWQKYYYFNVDVWTNKLVDSTWAEFKKSNFAKTIGRHDEQINNILIY